MQLLLFIFSESISDKNSFCDESIFLNLFKDRRASESLKDFISVVCFASTDKYFTKVNTISSNYENDKEYKALFDKVARSMIFPSSVSYGIAEVERVVLDISFIFSQSTNQNAFDDLNTYCSSLDGASYCSKTLDRLNGIKKSFLLDLPYEININNVENAAIVFVIAEDIFENDALEDFINTFFENHKIVFPSLDEILKYFDQSLASNELNIKNFKAIEQFGDLYFYASKHLFKGDDLIRNTELAKVHKEFSDFFMLSAKLLFELSSKDVFFESLKSQLAKDMILLAIHYSVLAHQSYEYFSENYDFVNFPLLALDLIIKVKRNDFDNSIELENYLSSDLYSSHEKSFIDLKNIYASNFRINNFLTLKSDLNPDDIANLRFEQDKNNRNKRDYLDSISNIKKDENLLIIDLMERLSYDEVLEYHFSIPGSYLRLVFRVYKLHIVTSWYEISDNEVNNLYQEVSNPQYIDKKRQTLEDLSTRLYGILSYNENIRSIYFVSDDILRLVPFHALQYEDKYLIESYKIHYLPSIYSFLKLSSSKKPDNFFGIGHPKFQEVRKDIIRTRGYENLSELSSLPETEDEILDISRIFQTRKVLLQGDATKNNFINSKDLHKNSLLYFATHNLSYGNSINDEPGLALTPDEDNTSGILTISEISTNNFSGSIIALSACKTFDAAFDDKEPYSGIAQSFFLGGARGVYNDVGD